MFFGERVPYTNFHDLNLDELIKTMLTIRDNAGATADKLQELLKGGLVTSVNGQTGDVEISVVGADTSIVNVKTEHGAVGDGATDDTDAIQAAIEHARTSGKILYFPPGVYALAHNNFDTDEYAISSALHIYSGMILIGENATLLINSPDVTHIIFTHNDSNAASYDGCHDIYIRGLTFDGNANLETNCTQLNLSHCKNVVIEDCVFKNCHGWHNLEINSTSNAIIRGCYVSDSTALEDFQIDKAGYHLGNLGQDDGTVSQYIEISNCTFVAGSHYRYAIGNHTDATNHNVLIHDNTFIGPFSATNGSPVNFVPLTYNVFMYNNSLIQAVIPKTINVNQFNNIFDSVADTPAWPNNLNLLTDKAINLNEIFTSQRIGSITIAYYQHDRDINGPGSANGLMISVRNPTSGNFGWQIVITNANDYKRRIRYVNDTLVFDAWRPIRGYINITDQITNANPAITTYNPSSLQNSIYLSNWNHINMAITLYINAGSYTQNTVILSGFPAPSRRTPVNLIGDSRNIRCCITPEGNLVFDGGYNISTGFWAGCNASWLESIPL